MRYCHHEREYRSQEQERSHFRSRHCGADPCALAQALRFWLMTFKEKMLYHQIHPLKLLTDISIGVFVTPYLLWQHNIFWFLILFLLPSVIVTFLLIKFADLEKQKNSKLGKYISKYMTHTMEGVRLFGQIIIWIAAWYQSAVFCLVGLSIIIFGWGNGLLLKK